MSFALEVEYSGIDMGDQLFGLNQNRVAKNFKDTYPIAQSVISHHEASIATKMRELLREYR